jgi:hypothetical protein
MRAVFVDVGMSLDGFIAGPNGRPGNPLGDGGLRIHQWVFPLVSFRERVGLNGGETGRDDEIVKATFARVGAYVGDDEHRTADGRVFGQPSSPSSNTVSPSD